MRKRGRGWVCELVKRNSETDSDAGVGIALTERPRTSALEALPTGVGACVFACLDAGDHTVLASASRLCWREFRSCPPPRVQPCDSLAGRRPDCRWPVSTDDRAT